MFSNCILVSWPHSNVKKYCHLIFAVVRVFILCCMLLALFLKCCRTVLSLSAHQQRTARFYSLNRFYALYELDFMFILSTDKSGFALFSQIANIEGAWAGHLKSARGQHATSVICTFSWITFSEYPCIIRLTAIKMMIEHFHEI